MCCRWLRWLAPGALGCLISVVRFVWQAHKPVATNGQYLSASLPIISLTSSTGTVSSELIMPRLVDYTVQSGTPPNSTTSYSWDWTTPVSRPSNLIVLSSLISFVAGDLAGLQQANRNAFYAGILLGVAAAVAVALLTNVLGAVDKTRRRRKKRQRQLLKANEQPTANI
jgi:uncharacterized membrane protein YkvI